MIIEQFENSMKILQDNFMLVFTNESSNSKITIDKGYPLICRFCGKTDSEVSFSDLAHAIPESIGNKHVFLQNECDTCNHLFGNGIETHFDKLSKIYRHIGQIRGKKGIPSIKTNDKQFRSDATQDGVIIQSIDKSGIVTNETSTNEFKYEIDVEPYIPVAVYKCLCKIALSVMPNNMLPYFEKTIQWIGDNDHSNLLMNPLIANFRFLPGPSPYTKPMVWLYKNSCCDKNKYPACVFLLSFGNITMQITVPSRIDAMRSNSIEFLVPPIFNKYELNQSFGPLSAENIDLSSPNIIKGKKLPVSFHYDRKEELDPSTDEVKRKLNLGGRLQGKV